MPRASESRLRVCLVYPDLLGTYGDFGNALILTQRLRWRGFEADLIETRAGEDVPGSCDFYVLGGGEDDPQALACAELMRQRSVHRGLEGGAAVLAVCAGFQIIGSRFVAASSDHDGLGLIDATTTAGRGRRAVGEIVVEPDTATGLPTLTGYENHGGVTQLGAGTRRLGRVVVGVGNGVGDGSEGAFGERIFATYLHGPVLARNPALADLILSSVVGTLPPLDDHEAEALRRERLQASGSGRRRRSR
jgi:lipid II isoglutaminyl synthase (glutamine-hydrolysing)